MDTPNSNTDDLVSAQENYEKRFSCPVCLDPKLKMVVSACQHRICSDCLYDSNDKLHEAMTKCPTCQMKNAFPQRRPDIPEDNIEMQRKLGVTECPMDGCQAGLWLWDVENHIESCPHAVVSPKPGSKRSRRQSQQPEKANVKTSPQLKRQKQSTPATTEKNRRRSASNSPPTGRRTGTSRMTTRSAVRSTEVYLCDRYPLRNSPQREMRQERSWYGQYDNQFNNSPNGPYCNPAGAFMQNPQYHTRQNMYPFSYRN